MREAEQGVAKALEEHAPVELPPQPPSIRRLQHRLVAHHHLEAVSEGSGGVRHLVVQPPPEEQEAEEDLKGRGNGPQVTDPR
jgi:predicted RNA-binding protein Jag